MARASEIAFACPSCGAEATSGLDGQGRCAACGAQTALALTASLRDERVVDRCPACQGEQLYVQRDFNQRAGLAIVIVGAALAPFTPFYSSLFVAAAIDAVLYLLLPEIAICYRCHAHFRGFVRNPRHEAFDLHVAEQYGTRRS
ncbi:MAG: hypothetical protein ACHQKZ_01835 [Solirubrobacterales bacterium]|jgi:DNA-directed RNA polymerase subunit RPC12/RpoP